MAPTRLDIEHFCSLNLSTPWAFWLLELLDKDSMKTQLLVNKYATTQGRAPW